MHRRTDGFTLIELLVVIAVIMILAAMVSPTIQRALRQATRAHCTSNLRQWGYTIGLYELQNDYFVPPGSTITSYLHAFYHSGTYRISEILIHDYHLARDVWFCPADEVWNDDYYWDPQHHGYGSATSYLYMGGEGSPSETYLNGAERIIQRMKVDDPVATLLMGDDVRFFGDTPNIANHSAGHGPDGLWGWRAYGIEGSNLLMAEGHVEWRKWPSDMLLRISSPRAGGLLNHYW